MPHFAVTYTYADRPADLDTHRRAHRAFLGDLHRRGEVVVSGPYLGPPGEPGALLIVIATDAAAAGWLLDDDRSRSPV